MGRSTSKGGVKSFIRSKNFLAKKKFKRANDELMLVDDDIDDFDGRPSNKNTSWESGWGDDSESSEPQNNNESGHIDLPPLDLPLPSSMPALLDPAQFGGGEPQTNPKIEITADKKMVIKQNKPKPKPKPKPKSPYPTNWGTLDDSIWKLRREYRIKRAKRGYKVINGQLLSVNDVGVLLREAAERVARRRKMFYANKPPAITTKLARKRRLLAMAKRRKEMLSLGLMNHEVTTPFYPDEPMRFNTRANRLVINTRSRADHKLLAIYNLNIGVNKDNLRKIIEKLGKTKLIELKVKDLLSGSAIGYATLERPTLAELQRVKEIFNGALVDGRTIKVDIITNSMAALAY